MPIRPSHRRSRRGLAAVFGTCVLAAAAGLSGCASRSPLPQLYRLPTASPAAPPMPTAVLADASTAGAWQLMLPVRLPAYLDDDRLLLPEGASGLQAQPLQRWAEPLRDAVPRVLLADLSLLRAGGAVWTAPLPAGLAPLRQLRVEVLAFEAAADRSSVQLQARWSLAGLVGGMPPKLNEARIDAPSFGGSAEALVAAHRLALWRLAERIAATH